MENKGPRMENMGLRMDNCDHKTENWGPRMRALSYTTEYQCALLGSLPALC